MAALRWFRATPTWVFPLVCGVLVLVAPQLGLSFSNQRQVILIAILTLLVSGLNLSLGYAGELALGQVAVYAAGAYLAGYLGAHGHTDILLQLATCALFAVVAGLLTGIPGLRLGSWSLAMTSFFLVLLVPDILAMLSSQTGGSQGLSGIYPATVFGTVLDPSWFYAVVVVVAAVWIAVMRNLVTSRHGTAFRVLRQSPVLASSVGISVYRMKLTAYALGAVPAGVAGCLFANLDHYLSPDSFTFSLAIAILAASVLGGSMSVYGAVVGAAILQIGPLEATSFQQYTLIAYGAFLIVGGIVLARGISGLALLLWHRLERRLPAAPAVDRAAELALTNLPGAALSVESVSKGFGGVRGPRRLAHGDARHDHRRHRSERLREDDVPQSHLGLLPGGQRVRTDRRGAAAGRRQTVPNRAEVWPGRSRPPASRLGSAWSKQCARGGTCSNVRRCGPPCCAFPGTDGCAVTTSRRPTPFSARWGSTTSPSRTQTPCRSGPAGCSRSPVHSSDVPECCSWTSRRQGWTRTR